MLVCLRRGAKRLLVTAPLLVSACTAVGPDFTRPDVPWLEGWSSSALSLANKSVANKSVANTSAANTSHSAPAVNGQWWRQFNDPVLDALVAEAQNHNTDVRTAGLRILEARAQLGIADSGLYPQVQQIGGNVLRNGRHSDASDFARSSYSIGFDIAWELDFWGKFRRGIEAADANYFASIASYDNVQVLVATQTATLYSAIRTLELRLRIARENASLQQRSLQITERLFKSGNESELDLQQAHSQYLSTLATIPELESSLRQTQNALSVLLARPPGPLPEMAAGREQIPIADLVMVVDLPADLLRRRPDVRAAELQLAAQSALIGVSEADLYPSLGLIGSVGLSADSMNWSARTRDWAFGSTLTWNVFDWGRLESRVLVEDARFQQLYEQYQGTVLRAARELDDAAVSFVEGRRQIDILRDAVQAARRSNDIATIQYREGLVDFERVLDAQRSLFSQQDRLVNAQGGVTQSLIAVYKALGGGWEVAHGQPLVTDETRASMEQRNDDWQPLIDAPLPAPSAPLEPSIDQEPTDQP
jgi:NodT family efflux transporter outer membrane factor (OMF) lipoprotein